MTCPRSSSTTGAFRTSSTRRACGSRGRSPEWTEHNVSDPGITLIELFAWMTDMLIYRLNRVPDKLHVALLELLGDPAPGPTAAAPPCASGSRRSAGDRSRSQRERPRSGRSARRPRSRSSSRSPRLHDPAGPPVGVCRAARRPVPADRRRGRDGAAAGPRPAPVRGAAAGRRRALPGLRRPDLAAC